MLFKRRTTYDTPPQSLPGSRNTSTTRLSATASEDWKSDDKGAMSSRESLPQRPVSVIIPPTVQYTQKRPTLREILSDVALPPWNLTAFMAYLSSNLCLETLEFTMDAARYRKHYEKMLSRRESNGLPRPKDCEYVQALWQRLVDAYIRPSGSREVNLPAYIRDPILNLRAAEFPPPPDNLDLAVLTIYELMETSVLVPFLNSVAPQITHSPTAMRHADHDAEFDQALRSQTRGTYPSPNTTSRPSPEFSHNRQSAPSTLYSTVNQPRSTARAATLGTSSNHGLTSSVSAPAGRSIITNDRGSRSPTLSNVMTPPTSPPTSDHSPKRDSGMWKKLGRLGKKPKPQGPLYEDGT